MLERVTLEEMAEFRDIAGDCLHPFQADAAEIIAGLAAEAGLAPHTFVYALDRLGNETRSPWYRRLGRWLGLMRADALSGRSLRDLRADLHRHAGDLARFAVSDPRYVDAMLDNPYFWTAEGTRYIPVRYLDTRGKPAHAEIVRQVAARDFDGRRGNRRTSTGSRARFSSTAS